MDSQEVKQKNNVSLSLNLKYVCLALLLVIVGMLALWRPWAAGAQDPGRTVKVTGEAKITAVPDEFVFYPNYEFKNADKDMALAELTKKSDEITKKLKELGVPDNKIKTSSNGYEGITYRPASDTPLPTYNLQITATVGSKDLAQKVQDYLVTTGPTGSVSPQANFSDTKRKELEQQARNKATTEARAKADQSARNLGFKVGKVKTLEDSGFGGIGCAGGLCMGASLSIAEDSKARQLSVQPGENELNYSVTVEYFIR